MKTHYHIKTLGFVFIVYGLAKILLSAIGYELFLQGKLNVNLYFDPFWPLMLSLFLAVLTIGTGIALLKNKPWSYPLAVIISALLLVTDFIYHIISIIVLYLILLIYTVYIFIKNHLTIKKIKKNKEN